MTLAPRLTCAFAIVLAAALTGVASADTFGTGPQQFDIAFTTIGSTGNQADTTGTPNPAGSVDYIYRMGTFEISEDMINKANDAGGLGITHDNRGPNKPATGITWFEAARFVNWLNDEKGASPAYKFNGSTFELWQSGDAGYDATNPFRNSDALYFLPSMDEWYKAAYFDPSTGGYFDFTTGSDTPPTTVPSGTAPDTAVFSGQPGPADIMDAGGLSALGIMAMGGNAWEWEESEVDLLNDSVSAARGIRGGDWQFSLVTSLKSDSRNGNVPTLEDGGVGFRVASLPWRCLNRRASCCWQPASAADCSFAAVVSGM